jgi:hypothetical protein
MPPGLLNGKRPDITAAQVISVLTWIITQAVSVGWVNNDQAQHWLQVGSSVIAAAWIIGDALLRGSRNVAAAKTPPVEPTVK